MENEISLIETENQLVINESTRGYLTEIRKWANFLSIVGFVFVGLMALMSIFLGVLFSIIPKPEMGFPLPTALFAVFYFLLTALYFFPVYYLYQFSVKLKHALLGKATDMLESSFRFLKSHYKFIGILTIIFLALYPIMIIVMIIIGAKGMGNLHQPGSFM